VVSSDQVGGVVEERDDGVVLEERDDGVVLAVCLYWYALNNDGVAKLFTQDCRRIRVVGVMYRIFAWCVSSFKFYFNQMSLELLVGTI